MPIILEEDTLVVRLGSGDVILSLGEVENDLALNELIFIKSNAPEIIGADIKRYAGLSSEEVDCPLKIIFGNKESLEVVIERLVTLRELLMERELKN